jgi:hypothetical protein
MIISYIIMKVKQKVKVNFSVEVLHLYMLKPRGCLNSYILGIIAASHCCVYLQNFFKDSSAAFELHHCRIGS